ncbi:MAG TPA: ABC transporter transmembrane domain-containing protein, partial [Armatimonadota bacterium]|nr:ABC transporter transmembrane domain-containing protein [Armatimonadota bacterium]
MRSATGAGWGAHGAKPCKKGSGFQRMLGRLRLLVLPESHDSVWRLWEYTRVDLRRIVFGCLCGIGYVLLTLATAYLIRAMLGALVDANPRKIALCAAATPLLYLIKGCFYYGQVYLLSSAAERLAQRLRNRLYEHMQTLSLSFFENQKTGGLMATIASDVPVIQQTFTVAILEGVIGPAMVVGGLLVMFYMNWRMAIVTIVSLVAIGSVISKASLRMRRASEAIQKSIGATSGLAT